MIGPLDEEAYAADFMDGLERFIRVMRVAVPLVAIFAVLWAVLWAVL